MVVFEQATPYAYLLGFLLVLCGWLFLFPVVLLAWFVLGIDQFLAESVPFASLVTVEITFAVILLLAVVAPIYALIRRARQRFGRAEVYPSHVGFEWAMTASDMDREHIRHADLQIGAVTEWGIHCSAPGRSWFRRLAFPLFVPARGTAQDQALRLLQQRGSAADWTLPAQAPELCDGCELPYVFRVKTALCPPCQRDATRVRSMVASVIVVLIVLGLLTLLLAPVLSGP